MDLKIKDVAELLNVSETTIRRWLSEGKIPAYRLHHQYRFSKIEIENWMMTFRLQKENETLFFPEEKQIYLHKESKKKEEQKGMQQFSLFRALHHGGVHADIEGTTKEEIIQNTMQAVADDLRFDPQVISELLMDREKLMPTALNNGIAVPHTRDFLLKGTTDVIVVVFPKKPLDWGALDENYVHTLFFLFACNDKRHLHLLAKLAYLSSNDEALKLFLSKSSKGDLLEYVKKFES